MILAFLPPLDSRLHGTQRFRRKGEEKGTVYGGQFHHS